MQTEQQRAAGAKFLALHQASSGFIMPNAWDGGSAAVLVHAGFTAIGTTSAGIAFALGRPDYGGDARLCVPRDAMFDALGIIMRAAGVPVNADLEAGFGDSPREVADTIGMAIDSGLAGANIEDRIPGKAELYEEALAVERIAAARAEIESRGAAFVLTARSDVLQLPEGKAPDAIHRLNRFREAGAHCLFAPGSSVPELAALMVREVSGPMNFVAGLGTAGATPAQLLQIGAQRVSLGGSIARAALGFVRRAAQELRESGTLDFARQQIPQMELNALFERG
jgi:2-methylisocitrate lyase-like PEP mutase family enzyme